MPIFRSEIARKSIAKRKGRGEGRPPPSLDCLPLLRGGRGTANCKTHKLPTHSKPSNEIDYPSRCDAWDKSSSYGGCPFLAVMHANEGARGDLLSSYHAAQSRGRFSIILFLIAAGSRRVRLVQTRPWPKIGSALLHFHLHRGRGRNL